MSKIAFIASSGFDTDKFLKGFEQKIITTQYGNVLLWMKDKIIFLLRHGKNKNIPPHRVNYKANICALNLQGVEKIVGICSVGSLKETIKAGSILIPDDYVDFSPKSFFDFEVKSIIPELNQPLIKEVKLAAKKAKVTCRQKGNYVQTNGPRFETKAEISIIKKWGDVVGMTLAKEATLAQEIGIAYTGICSVDNLAHGIGKKRLTEADIIKKRKANQPKIEKVVKELIKANKKKRGK